MDNVGFYILEVQEPPFNVVSMPSFNSICQLRKLVYKMTDFGVGLREHPYRDTLRCNMQTNYFQIA